MNNGFESVFADYLSGFVNMKRSLGYKYKSESELLLRFDRMILDLDVRKAIIDKNTYDNWAELSSYESALSKYSRLVCLNQFASYMRSQGVKSFIAELPKYPDCQYIPYIYSHDEISRIFTACDNLKSSIWCAYTPLPALPCLIRLLYATGIRIGEAIALMEDQINIEQKYLILKNTKNGKDRIIPLSESMTNACSDYLAYKHISVKCLDIEGEWGNTPFFTSTSGQRLKRNTVENWFSEILKKASIPSFGARKGPRLHDLRHTFACHSFVKQSEEGIDLYCSWPYLSTYLGHQSLESTEKYVRLTSNLYPEILKDGSNMYMSIIPHLTIEENETSI